MRIILFIVRKEFRQIFRNKAMLPLIFLMPVIQLLILSNAATYEIQDIRVIAIDKDNSPISHRLLSKLEGSPYFKLGQVTNNTRIGEQALNDGTTDIVMEIPINMEKNVLSKIPVKILLSVNAIDGVKAGLASSYLQAIVADYGMGLIALDLPLQRAGGVIIETSNWYNESLDYKTFMVPGILVLLVTMIGTFLTAMNIVREKEIGTIEQLNVTPIKKYQFIIGKLFPFLIIGLLEMTIGLLVAKLVFNTPFVGSLFLVFVFSTVYLLVVLGMGLLISTITETQQQAMFISWFFMVIFILMSGLFTPIESMPGWAQKITLFNPIRYFIEIMRMVMLKGSGFYEVRFHFLIISVYAIIINALATWQYRKTA